MPLLYKHCAGKKTGRLSYKGQRLQKKTLFCTYPPQDQKGRGVCGRGSPPYLYEHILKRRVA